MQIKKSIKVSHTDYFVKHLQIINPFLPIQLTPKELEVLGVFISLKGELANDRFGTTARKLVMEKTDISPGGLGNYLKSLKQKGFIFKRDGALFVIPIVLPTKGKQTYEFTVLNQEEYESANS